MNILYFDFETIGLYGKIRTFQYAFNEDKVSVVIDPNPDIIFRTVNKADLVVAHNIHYEFTLLQQLGMKEFPKFEDTYFLAKLNPEIEDLSLDKVYSFLFGFDIYEEHRINKREKQLESTWKKSELTHSDLQYCKLDIIALRDVYKKLQHNIDNKIYKFDKKTLLDCLKFQQNGIPVNQEKVEQKIKERETKVKEIGLPINARSYQQVREYLNVNSSDKNALLNLILKGDKKAEAVLKTKKLMNDISFLTKYNKPRLYGKFSPRAKSGRVLCNNDNLQQIPVYLRDIIETENYFVYADFSQLELRTISAITKDPKMLEIFINGLDIHDISAQNLFGQNFTKEERKVAKCFNFGALYGAGVGTLLQIIFDATQIKLDFDKGAELKKKWLQTYRNVNRWQQAGRSKWRAGQYNKTPFGRVYKAKRLTDFLNLQNQGYGAEIARVALHYILETIESPLGLFVHDAYLIETDSLEQAKMEAHRVADCMIEAWRKYRLAEIPMPVEVFIGKNWGKIENECIFKVEKLGR